MTAERQQKNSQKQLTAMNPVKIHNWFIKYQTIIQIKARLN